MTDADYTTFLASGVIDATWELGATSANDLFFERFDCTGSVASIFKCYKFQVQDPADMPNDDNGDPAT